MNDSGIEAKARQPPLVDHAELVGETILGRYQLERLVASTGHSYVYRAKDQKGRQPVAVKVLAFPAGVSGKEQATLLQRFQDEARIMTQLSSLHAGVARCIDDGIVSTRLSAATPILVLEWLEGRNLAEQVALWKKQGRAPLPPGEVIELLDPAAQALAIAHEQGMAHRDVKPANIFLARILGRQCTKLLDFGVAKIMELGLGITGASTSREGDASASLTPMYGAPEQWNVRYGATGPWSDVFSLALVCLELLALKSPLQGNTVQQLMGACLDETRRSTPRSLGIDLGEKLEAVFAKATALQPRARYRSCGEFWSELCVAANGLGQQPNSQHAESAGNDEVERTVQALPGQSFGNEGLTADGAVLPSTLVENVFPQQAAGGSKRQSSLGTPTSSSQRDPSFGTATASAKNGGRIPPVPPRNRSAKRPNSIVLFAAFGGVLLVLSLGFSVMRNIRKGKKERVVSHANAATVQFRKQLQKKLTKSPLPTDGEGKIDPKKLTQAESLNLPTAAFISLVCMPGCSEVVIGGQAMGPSPWFAKQVAAGGHRMSLIGPSGERQHVRVYLRPGEHRSLSIKLGWVMSDDNEKQSHRGAGEPDEETDSGAVDRVVAPRKFSKTSLRPRRATSRIRPAPVKAPRSLPREPDRPKRPTIGKCGCAASDLMCQMRCSVK